MWPNFCTPVPVPALLLCQSSPASSSCCQLGCCFCHHLLLAASVSFRGRDKDYSSLEGVGDKNSEGGGWSRSWGTIIINTRTEASRINKKIHRKFFSLFSASSSCSSGSFSQYTQLVTVNIKFPCCKVNASFPHRHHRRLPSSHSSLCVANLITSLLSSSAYLHL